MMSILQTKLITTSAPADGYHAPFNSSVIAIASAILTTMTKPPRFGANNAKLLGRIIDFQPI
jgi:hypothetical protein